MKHLLLTTIAAVVLVGCGPSVSLHEAVRWGDIETVKQHLDTGTDVNAKGEAGRTPLHWAALKGRKDIAELLIAKGADVNATNGVGTTPLHWAAGGGHKKIVELLIAEGADVNAKRKRSGSPTPLDDAIQTKQKQIASLLRKHGGKTGEELKTAGN